MAVEGYALVIVAGDGVRDLTSVGCETLLKRDIVALSSIFSV